MVIFEGELVRVDIKSARPCSWDMMSCSDDNPGTYVAVVVNEILDYLDGSFYYDILFPDRVERVPAEYVVKL